MDAPKICTAKPCILDALVIQLPSSSRGIAGLLMPGTAALLHNTSTIGLCLNNMRNILQEAEEYVYQ